MNHQHQSVCSSKQKIPQPDKIDAKFEIGKKEKEVYVKITDIGDEQGTVNTNQTGNLPVMSKV